MKKSIYEIEVKHLQLAETLEENGGELTPELELELAINQEELQTKGVAYSFVIKDLTFLIAQIDSELKRLTDLKKAKQKAIDRLENSLSTAMQIFEVEKIETPMVKISFRNSETVEVYDMALLDREYTKVSDPVVSADKVKIKEALKRGEQVVGAVLQTNKNIQIK
jgi:hypothetical protein